METALLSVSKTRLSASQRSALISLLAGVLSDKFGIRAPFVLSFVIAAICFVFYAVPGELPSRLEKAVLETPPVIEPGA